MLRKLLCVCCVLAFVAPAMAVDVVYYLVEGMDPMAATTDSTYEAVWNGAGYDDLSVFAWIRDVGNDSATEDWVGFQVAFDDAIPVVGSGAAGSIDKVFATSFINTGHADWFMPLTGGLVPPQSGYPASSDAPGFPAVQGYSLSRDPYPALGEDAKYLAQVTYSITADAAGTWIIRPRCTSMDACEANDFCANSYVSCVGDGDCPRYSELGDAADLCTNAISPDADTFFTANIPVVAARPDHSVWDLLIEIPSGQCCDGTTCLGEFTQEHCVNVLGGVWNGTKTCADDCLCLSNADCEDGDACTDNVCGGDGQCVYPLNYDDAVDCCDSATGTLTTIDDLNGCTEDICETDGSVTHTPLAYGTETPYCLADAGEQFIDNGCTLNFCDGAGGCAVFNIDGTSCTDAVYTGGACLSPTLGTGGECTGPGDTCVCTSVPSLLVNYTGGKPGFENCFAEGAEVYVTVSMTNSALEILAAHINVEYDPTCLTFVSITPAGSVLNEWTPQWNPPVVNEATGEIVFEVFGGWAQPPNTTPGPEDLALITFTRNPTCDDCEVCVVPGENPGHTFLADGFWEPIIPDLTLPCTDPIHFNGELEVTVPGDDGGNLLCDEGFAVFTWDAPTASHPCIDPTFDCVCASFNGTVGWFEQSDCDALIWGGGEFPAGTFVFECTATDDCGDILTDSWTITVSNLTTVVAEVELQPLMSADYFTRCIVFELFPDCIQPKQVVMVDMEFNDFGQVMGHATAEFKTLGGYNYDCITARDPFHTLRSVVERDTVDPLAGPLYCADGKLMATFKSTHSEDYWLVGGNLDGNDRIDIIDFGMLLYQYSLPMTPIDDACGDDLANLFSWDGFPDADINSDGVVDLDDFSFIATNYLMISKNSCCPDALAGSNVPMTSVSVAQLELMGLGHLSIADRNGDGMVDTEDMVRVMNGDVPQQYNSVKVRGGTRIRADR